MIKKYISVYGCADSCLRTSTVWYEEIDDGKKMFIKEKRIRSFKSANEANKWAERLAKKKGFEFIAWGKDNH
jgi:hypothetical protein